MYVCHILIPEKEVPAFLHCKSTKGCTTDSLQWRVSTTLWQSEKQGFREDGIHHIVSQLLAVTCRGCTPKYDATAAVLLACFVSGNDACFKDD